MNWLKYLVIPVLLILGIFYFFAQCQTEVVVATAQTGQAVNAVAGTVKLLASVDITLKTEHAGRVTELPGYLGQSLNKGDTVARLNTARYENERRQLLTRLEAARERAELPLPVEFDIRGRAASVEAMELRMQQNRASEADLRNEQRELDKLINYRELELIQRQEHLALMEQQLRWLDTQIEELHIRAPIDGKVVEQFVFADDYIHPGASVVRMVTEDRYLEMTLSEENAAGVTTGQTVVTSLASFPWQEFRGEVTSLSATANADTKTRTITVTLAETAEDLVPGLTGEAYLIKEEREGNVIIPRRALMGREVYVARQGRVAIVPVTPGFLSLNRAEIVEGIEPGDQVITEGHSDLRAGDRIRTSSNARN